MLVRDKIKWLDTKKTFEWFSSAGMNVETGHFATFVVSAWTWPRHSSLTFYRFLSVWQKRAVLVSCWCEYTSYNIRNTSSELKRMAPSSHTFPEIT